MMMRNPAGGSEKTIGDLELAITGNVALAEADYLTFFSDMLLSAAAICGLIETFCRSWTDHFHPAVFGPEADHMLSRSTLGFLVTILTAFVAIKSQGQTGFPFQTHPQLIMVSVTSLLIYGLASDVEHVITSSGADPTSVYAIVTRLGRIASLYISVASLASLLYV